MQFQAGVVFGVDFYDATRDTVGVSAHFFSGCTALITGASSGLGWEFARQLAPAAACLVLVARRGDRLEALKQELENENPHLQVIPRVCDLADDGQLQEFIDWIYRDGPAVDFLINNAGLGDHGDFESSDWEKIRRMLEVNIVALTKLSYVLLPMLRQHKRAGILNVSSIASLLPMPGLAVYAATKAYVTSLSEAIRIELRGSGVTVTALCPGPVHTEFGEVAARGPEDPMRSPEFFKVSVAGVVRTGLEAVASDRPRAVPGWMVWGAMSLVALLPLWALRTVLAVKRPV